MFHKRGRPPFQATMVSTEVASQDMETLCIRSTSEQVRARWTCSSVLEELVVGVGGDVGGSRDTKDGQRGGRVQPGTFRKDLSEPTPRLFM